MKVRPIIFSALMIRALLEGRKTQTRRIIKPQPAFIGDKVEEVLRHEIGELRYVRETCAATVTHDELNAVRYDADEAWRVIDDTVDAADQWLTMHHYRGKRGATVPPIHMPRWASRLTLEVKEVRVERVQSISESDAIAEGIERLKTGRGYYDPTQGKGVVHFGHYCRTAKDAFSILWDDLNADRGFGWEANPWVTATTFDLHRSNVDDLLKEREAA